MVNYYCVVMKDAGQNPCRVMMETLSSLDPVTTFIMPCLVA